MSMSLKKMLPYVIFPIRKDLNLSFFIVVSPDAIEIAMAIPVV